MNVLVAALIFLGYETWGSQDVRACSYTWLTSAAGSHPATVDVIATAVSSPTSTAKNGAAQAVGVLKSGAVKIGTQPRATAVVILIGVLAMLVFQAAL
jgi:hypothetical protein